MSLRSFAVHTMFLKSLRATLAVLFAVAVGSSQASNTNGNIAGQILEAGKTAAVSGAMVTVTNDATGQSRSATVSADGSFRFSGLSIGTYSLDVSAPGYVPGGADQLLVSIGTTTSVTIQMNSGNALEEIRVVGSAAAPIIDLRSSETALNITTEELEKLPVPRSLASVALLAPGVNRGDSRFGGLPSFGGSSVAENQIYINGLNVTNFRNGLGFSNVPYEFYEQFQVKTGGYSAEFGRSTGGVINAVTKSGSNEFKVEMNAYFRPNSLRETGPNVRSRDGDWLQYRGDSESDNWDANISVSGPIIKDKLFYHVIYNPRNFESISDNRKVESGRLSESTDDDDFWGAKIDWNITDDHRLELLAFEDTSTFTTYDVARGTNAYSNSGGENWSAKYTGYLFDDSLMVSAMYGENEYNLTTSSDLAQQCSLFYDYRNFYGGPASAVPYFGVDIGCAGIDDYFVEEGFDQREAMRFDLEWTIGDHVIRAGIDREINTSNSDQKYSGPNGAYYLIFPYFEGESAGGEVITADVDLVRDRIRTVGGAFETEASAIYIEDTWQVSDNLVATIGLRNESFDNMNGAGNTFVKIDDMLAPRLGLTFDINGDGSAKLFANAGRYFLPVANNTNVRLAGNESDTRSYYVLEGLNPVSDVFGDYYEYVLGRQVGTTQVLADGEEPDTRSIVADGIDPMYQDEFIIGYQAFINDDWSWGIKGTRRKLNGAIDDMIIDHAIVSKFGCSSSYDHTQYVLGNPGMDMRVWSDTDCDEIDDAWVNFTADELVYDRAVRTYNAVDLNLTKQWDGKWYLSANYTWSHSYGNSEGLVKSDNGQTDAGLTTDFDFPELMDGAYGDLPNDRRHAFKLWGSYAITNNLLAGVNINATSGRPLNAFGLGHPNVGEVDYGATYYTASDSGARDEDGAIIYDYTKNPRGSQGRTPWIYRVDANLRYETELLGARTTFKVDVFNIFNFDKHTRIDENVESTLGNYDQRSAGLPISFQTPRYVQLSASVKF